MCSSIKLASVAALASVALVITTVSASAKTAIKSSGSSAQCVPKPKLGKWGGWKTNTDGSMVQYRSVTPYLKGSGRLFHGICRVNKKTARLGVMRKQPNYKPAPPKFIGTPVTVAPIAIPIAAPVSTPVVPTPVNPPATVTPPTSDPGPVSTPTPFLTCDWLEVVPRAPSAAVQVRVHYSFANVLADHADLNFDAKNDNSVDAGTHTIKGGDDNEFDDAYPYKTNGWHLIVATIGYSVSAGIGEAPQPFTTPVQPASTKKHMTCSTWVFVDLPTPVAV